MDDLISRQTAIDALDGEITVTGRVNAEAVRGYANLVCDRIKRLPSAQPEPKTGRWLDTYNDGDWHCSECGAIVEKDEQIRHYWQRCYHCGARMEEVSMDERY